MVEPDLLATIKSVLSGSSRLWTSSSDSGSVVSSTKTGGRRAPVEIAARRLPARGWIRPCPASPAQPLRRFRFLNHDDLWFPDHLERCIATIEMTGSDLVYSIVDRPYPNGRRMANGIFPSGRYLPGAPVPASSWLFRRSLARSVGPWRHHRETRSIPSRTGSFEHGTAGHALLVPHLTVVTIGTSARPGCYTNRDEAEQAEYWHNIESDPSTRCTRRVAGAGTRLVFGIDGLPLLRPAQAAAGCACVQARETTPPAHWSGAERLPPGDGERPRATK